jgi:phage-related protein
LKERRKIGMSTNVGAVDMELVLNSNPFNQQLKNTTNTVKNSGIEGALGKIGKIAAAAFSVEAIVSFGKECIELGSNLSEVQNVVDVTFGDLNTQVNEFAQNAIEQFGLGQTVTKKYVGTFGAMSKSFGFSNEEALKMSETLTGLTGDVASFYNLSSDESYTKLKSVFTGETESLKDLGVVMTQNALDQYALANGYGKTTSKMSEQEKVALRYKFVMDKLSIASGDFARTSDSWANQTRVLSLRFNELKASLGQGLINIFTPFIKVINLVISKLQILANYFKSFTEMIFGNAGGDDSSSSVSNLATEANNASNAVDGIGESAKKTKKALQGLRGIDQINNLTPSKDDSSSGSGASGGIDSANLLDSTMQKANTQMGALANKAKELIEIFKEGFNDAFENTGFDEIINSCERIKTALIEIFTDSDISEYANEWIDTVLYNLGRLTGSVASIGVTIADNLLGGIANFLEQNQEDIQEHIINMFSRSSAGWDLAGDIFETFADIFAIFRGPEAKQCTADIIAIFTDGLFETIEIGGQIGYDILYMITQPFIENKDLIKESLEGILQPVSSILGTIKQGIQDTFSKFWEVYDTYIRPAVENIKDGFSSILETCLKVWNENIEPIFDEWAKKFDDLWQQHLQPMVNSFLEFVGKLVNVISELWNQWLVPIINWIVENVVPVLQPIIQTLGNLIGDVFGVISSVVGGIFEALGGLIDFIAGVFSGDWSRAWDGIKSIFSGIWNAIKGIFEGVWNAIKDFVTGILDTIKNLFSNIWNGIKEAVSGILNGIKEDISFKINLIKTVLSNILNSIKDTWGKIWNGLKDSVGNIWNAIKDKVVNGAKGALQGIKNVFGSIGNWFSSIFGNAWNNVKNIFSAGGKIFDGIKDGIGNAFKSIVNRLISGINRVVSIPFNAINSALRTIRNVRIMDFQPFSWLSTVSVPQIPYLAQGGYVKANTPQLAMIGDNRHQGEIVAPEDKIHSIVADELKNFKGTDNSEIVRLLKEILKYLKNTGGDIVLSISDIEIARAVIRGMKLLQSKTDKSILDFI